MSRRHVRDAVPILLLAVMLVTMFAWPAAIGVSVDSLSVFNVLRSFSDYGLVVLAVGLTVLIGELDLSAASMFALGGVLAIKFGGDAPVVGMLVAMGFGAVAGAVQGGIIALLRISSLPVTLGGYLIFYGAAQEISNESLLQYSNSGFSFSFDERFASVFSPRIVAVVCVFLLVGLVFHLTRVGRHIRSVGSDVVASEAAGVPIRWVVCGVFAASGALAGLGGAWAALAVASANPNAGFAPLIVAVISIVVGGVALTGGRGTVVGIAAGTLALAALNQTLASVGAPEYASSLVTGGLLLATAVVGAPYLVRRVAAARRRRSIATPVPGQPQADPHGSA